MPQPLVQSTGRRKEAIARVRLRTSEGEGDGTITVNGRALEHYFPSKTHVMVLTEPLRVTETLATYDVDATIHGGGPTGQAGALRLGIARALIELDPELRPVLKRAGFLRRDAARRSPRSTASRRPGRPRSTASARQDERPRVRAMLKFGTDGVRGVALTELTPELVLALGRAAARTFAVSTCVIARDTRESGPTLEAALAAGLAAEGVEVVHLGVAPTPAAAWTSAADGVLGAVISASHNPYQDNGVKLFAPGGRKLTDPEEEALEAALHRLLHGGEEPFGEPAAIREDPHPVERWQQSVVSSIGGRGLGGLRVVVDCAHGAASRVGPRVLRALGAEVTVLHADPDGRNINAASGSTYPETLQRTVVESAADAGIAFDGDADRALAVDATGRVVDGDHLVAISAIDRKARGALPGDAVVATVMANLGFRRGMEAHGIEVVEVPVGDRHVLAALDERGLALGGEQSGHVIHRDLATTGDGLLTAVQLLDVVAHTGAPLAELAAAAMTQLPQVLRNVPVHRPGPEVAAEVADEVAAAEAELGGDGRVLLRPSGTEPLVRVMVEAPTQAQAEAVADRLAAAVAARP